ncbi:MAG: hypothetical protein QF449_10710 [Alphaproteobacteria bacterium]|jgi:hypothetical protein|nr:hypothetical protein [Alphaproteobacteria bacterium]MDP6589111.1 hypothetical protein [Alphaproteobacteria bacterium]MDP6818494.1 hypothetical protein [Alphaproteobacteria bacterium]|tara:strand:+ start:1037 stop:1252 length:216 start_codon:yes stop_codon:yes gene_type:complete
MADIVSLRGATPAEIFSSGLDNLDEIEEVALSVLWKDGRVTAGWSATDMSKLAFMILALDEEQRKRNLRGE